VNSAVTKDSRERSDDIFSDSALTDL